VVRRTGQRTKPLGSRRRANKPPNQTPHLTVAAATAGFRCRGGPREVVLVSEATVAELDEVLRRPKFNKYVTEEKRLEFLAAWCRRRSRWRSRK